MSTVIELYNFFRIRKKFWLIPLVLVSLLLVGLLIVAQTTALGPLIYTVF
jgi:hypothetical protein